MNQKTLKKSNNKMIAGICAGIAEYLGWQPLQVRMLFVAIFLLGGASFFAYVVLFFFMPPPDHHSSNNFDIEDFQTN